MGTKIKDILVYEETDVKKIKNKSIAIDSFNMIYQFLASIRQADGSPLKDSQGEVTSHLKGLFNRCLYLKKNNIKAVFIFDGQSPKLKEKEQLLRAEKKMHALTMYKEALEKGDLEEAKKYSQGTSKITKQIIEESKKLIELFGFVVLNAPSEGEAQASFLVEKGKIWATASQDFDSLIFGSKFLIRNLSVGNVRKIPGTNIYKEAPIEFYDLKKNLETLKLNLDELIILAILVGTDFNPGGIKGIGPKKALKLIREHKGKEFDEIFKKVKWENFFEHSWQEVFEIFKNIEKDTNIESFEFKSINKQAIIEFLAKKDFDTNSVTKSLSKIQTHKSLESFF